MSAVAAPVARQVSAPPPEPRRRRRALVLTGVYLALAAFYIAHSLPRATPFGFLDELIYGKLAQNLGFGEGLSYQGVPVTAYKTIYPFVIAPVWAIFSDHDRAYHAVLVVNALLMSAVLFPAYAIARRIVTFPWAVTAGAAAALTPAMAWASMVMTESIAYPLAGLSLWATIVAVARPGPKTAVVAVAAACLAASARSGSLVLLAVFALAVVIDVARFGGGWRERAAAHRVSLLVIGGGLLAALAIVALGRRESLVGTYGGQNSEFGPSHLLGLIPEYITVIAVSTLLVPFVALIVLGSSRRWWRDRELGPLLVVATAAVICYVVVAAWATAALGPPLRERYVFYPTVVLAALWVGLWGRASPRAVALASAALAVWMVPLISGLHAERSGAFVNYTLGGIVDSKPLPLIAELPVWLGRDVQLWAAAMAGLGLLSWWALRRGRTRASIAVFVIPPLLFGAVIVSLRNHDLGVQAQMQYGMRMEPPDAIDAISGGEPAAFVRTGTATARDLWHLELWNRTLDRSWRTPGVEPRKMVGQDCELAMSPDGEIAPSQALRETAEDPQRPCAGRALARFLVFNDPSQDERVLNGRLRLRSNGTTVWEVPPGVRPRLRLTPSGG